MFPKTYFPQAYFPGAYFPPVQASAVSTTIAVSVKAHVSNSQNILVYGDHTLVRKVHVSNAQNIEVID